MFCVFLLCFYVFPYTCLQQVKRKGLVFFNFFSRCRIFPRYFDSTSLSQLHKFYVHHGFRVNGWAWHVGFCFRTRKHEITCVLIEKYVKNPQFFPVSNWKQLLVVRLMDELYGFHSSVDTNFNGDGNSIGVGLSDQHNQQMVLTAEVAETHEGVTGLEMSDIIKAQIAYHPLYPDLLSAYIECRKVGAPPEMVSLLEEISKENYPLSSCCSEIGTDPELDEFMKSYCEVLHKYKEELSRPFDEATSFLSSIESQLNDLCKETLPSATISSLTSLNYHSADDFGGRSDEDVSCGELEASESLESCFNQQGDEELKQMLMHKYSGYLGSLRKEFLKKRKKGKLPKNARTALLLWWNTHYRWPYPTEEEKNRLSEATGLDQKQINNWFINQRKRHWRPSEDMRFAVMEGVSGGINHNYNIIDVSEGGLDNEVVL